MSIEKKLLGTSPSGDAQNVEDVFSTYLYEGTGSSRTITNGIDLDGEGGMVWIKNRDMADHNYIHDTERGASYRLITNLTVESETQPNSVEAFNSDGFSLGYSGAGWNALGESHVSWTFRKAPRFFDVVTFTADAGSNNGAKAHPHNLEISPGFIIIKRTDAANSWPTFHRSLAAYNLMDLGATSDVSINSGYYSSVSDTHVTVGNALNEESAEYVMYLFAHDPDGENDDGMIACGSYTTDVSQDATISLGWEPQWLLVKRSDSSIGGDWRIINHISGLDYYLEPNTSDAEAFNTGVYTFNADGFTQDNFGASRDFIYMAIRAPMMKEPEAASDVFAVDTRGSTEATANGVVWNASFPVDLAISRNIASTSSMALYDRFRNDLALFTDTNAAESSQGGTKFDNMYGFDTRTLSANTNQLAWMFKRAKGFFDVVAYTGNGTAGRTVDHNLGVVPEMMWVKSTTNALDWKVYHKSVGAGSSLALNTTAAEDTGGGAGAWNSTAPTDSVFTLGSTGGTNYSSSREYIAYLFATLTGISKVGSYTGNGSNQNIDCGFSAGARFVLIKRTGSTGDWYLWDTERGIVTGNDPHLSLNSNSAEVTTDDSIDPQSAGFTVNQVSATNINVSSATYIFLAIA